MIRQQISILKDLEPTKTDDVIRSNSICRFCLRIFQLREKQIAINNFIRKEFNEITRTELKEAENYSKNICKDCFSSIQEFATFRALLIQNQKLIDDDSLRTVDVALKIENESEDEEVVLNLEREESIEVYYEEHLEEHEESNGEAEDHLNDQLNISRQSNKMTKGGRNKLCSDCGKTYSSHAYKRHYERVHLKLKKYHCDYCSYKAYSRSHMEIHVKSHLKIKSHFCELCGISFGSANILRQHYLTHQDNRPFTCSQVDCFLSFKSIYALRRHQKTHSDDKWKFHCDECSAKFTDKWHLKRHKNGHQLQAHPCETCGKVFGTEDRMKAHQIYHRNPKFKCDVCGKQFFKNPDLKTHLKTHTGQKDFQCSFCPNSYFKNAHLNRHMKIHQSQKNIE